MITIRYVAVALSVSVVAWTAPSVRAESPTAVRATLDLIRYGGNAPCDYAEAKGYFAKYGFHVTWDPAKGSQDAVVRVASGVASVGLVDVSTLVDFASDHPDKAPKIVLVVQDRSPQVIISLKKSSIRQPADLVGRVLSSAQTDAASKMFPAFMKINGLSESQVKRNIVDIRLRDPMLARGEADGIIGFDYTAVFNLRGLGVPADDISVLYYADFGLDLYGQSVVVNRDFLAENPETVKHLVSGLVRAWAEAVRDPVPAIQAIAALEPTTRVDLESARLKWLIDHEVVTPNTQKNGIGADDPARMQRNIDSVAAGLNLANKPKLGDIYDSRFLPPVAERQLPLTN
ncbi:MAG: ABC transporter substrate-binding protein [Alphaproteobacteria bacterium]|nr:ABC transporter substrate-binding protein [Alphaproteobacteria bacterium]